MTELCLGILLLIFLIGVVVLLVYILSQRPLSNAEPQETTRSARPVVFQRRPRPAFQRHDTRAQLTSALPKATIMGPNNHAGRIKTHAVTINFDAICRITGRTKRICGCGKCQEEREKFGT
jgi:hypothetical protein